MADYLKIPEVARRLDVSEPTVRRMVKGGKLPSVFIGGAYRVSEHDLEDYLESARVIPGKAQAPQPSLEDAAQSEAIQEALAVLFRGLARRGQRIVEESRKHGSSEALSRDVAEFHLEEKMLGRLKQLEVGPSIYGRDTDELAEAEDRYQEAAQAIQHLLAQDVDAPEMAREADSFRRARKSEAKEKDHETKESQADAS